MIKAFFSDLDDTLTYGFMHPEVQGQPMPSVLEVIKHLKEQGTPIKVLSNQAGVLYEHFQDDIMQIHPEWKRRDYPTVMRIADMLSKSMHALGLMDIYVAVYDGNLQGLLVPLYNSLTNPSLVTRAATMIAQQLQETLVARGINAQVSGAPNWRKPEIGMLRKAADDLGIKSYSDDDGPEEFSQIVYCGDMHTGKQRSDYLLAKNAGVQFLRAEDIRTLVGKSTIDADTDLAELDDHPF